MSASRSLLVCILVILAASCSDQPTTTSNNPPSTGGAQTYHYSFLAEHMRMLGSRGVYTVWFKYVGDSTFSDHTPMLAFFRPPPDSMTFEGDVRLTHSSDSLQEILVTVERDTGMSAPSAPLVRGSVTHLSAFLSSDSTFGRLQDARATITFATQSNDTTRAQHEFYLMTLAGGIPVASAIDLPVAPVAWRYALWVTDSSFEPKHLFYYGSFSDPNGPDSDTTAGEYHFAGGYRPNLLTDPGAQILLTLEPQWRLASRPAVPMPFNVMQLPLKHFIHDGESIEMSNVAAIGLPHGYFTLKKK